MALLYALARIEPWVDQARYEPSGHRGVPRDLLSKGDQELFGTGDVPAPTARPTEPQHSPGRRPPVRHALHR